MRSSKHALPALFFILLMAVSLSHSSAEEVNEIEAEGVAVILQGNLAMTREAATEEALRKSVEQAVGIVIDSQTLVENSQLVSDRAYSQSRAYMKGYHIIKEEKADPLFRVGVEASVATGHLRDDLSALRILLTRAHKPRMTILLEERMD